VPWEAAVGAGALALLVVGLTPRVWALPPRGVLQGGAAVPPPVLALLPHHLPGGGGGGGGAGGGGEAAHTALALHGCAAPVLLDDPLPLLLHLARAHPTQQEPRRSLRAGAGLEPQLQKALLVTEGSRIKVQKVSF